MSAVARVSVDNVNTGHGCDSIAGIEGQLQTKVFINGSPAAVMGDAIASHTILSGGSCVPHSAVINQGSSKVFCQGIAIARVNDSADAGAVATGSPTCSAGG